MKNLITICFLLFTVLLYAQKEDSYWLAGYLGGGPSDSIGITEIIFTDGMRELVNNQNYDFDIQDTNTSICDADGDLLFYFNGADVGNIAYDTMDNGYHLNNGDDGGLDLPQGGLILRDLSNENIYHLFYGEELIVFDPSIAVGMGFYHAIIDMAQNDGLGKVTQRKLQITSDTLSGGRIVATRHANGRDWWIVISELFTNTYKRYLLTPEGMKEMPDQMIGEPIVTGFGMAGFAPDGSKYVVVEGKETTGPAHVYVYDFDRCTGLLSNYRHWEIPIGLIYSEGCAISPNSRYLYAFAYSELWQYDLWADDIEASGTLVAEYDGFQDLGFFSTRFYQAALAPDGKIYGTAPSAARYMHIIHRPDELGLACMVEQHGLRLPTFNSFAAPNWPNYRLGPLDGSPCDTLGLDNLPLARFRIDTTETATTYGFHDLSDYEPTEWSWSFGDGSTSTERHPTHTFPDEAPYEVCLTVSNPYGSDTKCRGVNGFIVSTGELLPYANGVLLYPNPARDVVQLRFERTLPKDGHFELYDALGRRVLQRPLPAGHDAFTLPLRGVAGGVYFYRVAAAGVLLDSGRLVVE